MAPIDIGNKSGKNFHRPKLTGPDPVQKRTRAELLSERPNLFTGNREKPVRINDVAKSMGVDKLITSEKMAKQKRMK